AGAMAPGVWRARAMASSKVTGIKDRAGSSGSASASSAQLGRVVRMPQARSPPVIQLRKKDREGTEDIGRPWTCPIHKRGAQTAHPSLGGAAALGQASMPHPSNGGGHGTMHQQSMERLDP